MYVHTLEFVDSNRLASAFEKLVSSEWVEDCLVETDRLRIRFVAEPERASALVQRIYLDGGLRLSLRHHVASSVIPVSPADP
ncbi:MAG TPA: hypothetical protein VMR50_09845 [Myxococcota bacterium]|nr:hypothetical protein [Myxococcota bacterium]